MIERALVAILAAGTMAFGAVYPWGYWPLAAATALIGLRAYLTAAPRPDRRHPPLALPLAAVAAGIALQTLPLPRGAILALSPATDSFLTQYELGYAAQPPAMHALSIDVWGTVTALALFAALAVFLIGLAREGTRVHFERVVGGLVVFGLVLAFAGVIQRAALPPDRTHLVYGFWAPIFKGDPFGPFINRNHFAGWMILTTSLSMGYALAALERSRRPRDGGAGSWLRWLATPEASRVTFVLFAVLAMATSIALTRSRSGIAGFLVAMGFLTVMIARRAAGARTRWLAVAFGVVMAGGAVAWSGTEATLSRFSLASVDAGTRLSAWRDTWHIIGDFPWFGVGLGNYGTAMLLYQTAHRDTLFAQAHNDYLQVLAEGGLLVAVPAAIALVAIALLIRRRLADPSDSPARRWLRVGAVAGMAGIAAQSVFEFSLQMPAIAALFAFTIAVAVHRGPGPASDHRHAHRL